MTDNYTPIFNEVLEALCKVNLSPYETRVLMAIWRKTYGFIDKSSGERKKVDYIATSQIAEMCDLDKRHVSRALKGLKDKKVISRDDKKTGFSKEFMKLLSSVEGISPVQGVGIPASGTQVSPVLAPQKKEKETNTKEITTNVVTERSSDIDEVSGYFLQVMKIPKEDCPIQKSRRYWQTLLREGGRGVDGVKRLIDLAGQDEWYKNNITSSMDLYYKRIKLIARKRGNSPMVAVMPKEAI
jgi:phage replication O-like protein O